jgi:hypothetical protein
MDSRKPKLFCTSNQLVFGVKSCRFYGETITGSCYMDAYSSWSQGFDSPTLHRFFKTSSYK